MCNFSDDHASSATLIGSSQIKWQFMLYSDLSMSMSAIHWFNADLCGMNAQLRFKLKLRYLSIRIHLNFTVQQIFGHSPKSSTTAKIRRKCRKHQKYFIFQLSNKTLEIYVTRNSLELSITSIK